MAPLLRIAGRDGIAITISGLSAGDACRLRADIISSSDRAGLGPALCVSPADSPHDLVLSGTPDALKRLTTALASQSGDLADLFRKTDSLLDNYLRSDYKIVCRDKTLDLESRTHVMGILNTTPDSFSDGGRYVAVDHALAHAREMVAAGADIIDIGGESTRPGADAVSEEEELRRIVPLIERLAAELPVPVSVDTYKASVADKALRAGASIVNDISGLRFSQDMARVAAGHGAAVVIMHIKGTPRNMQQNPVYSDVIGEIMEYLAEGIDLAASAGIDREKIIIDPGIGFGKTLEHNLTILNRLDEFRSLGRPILLGTSRKKFIGAVLDIAEPDRRIDGTAATVALGIARGARIVRVHDVAQMVRVAKMSDAIITAPRNSEFGVRR